jgi:hypothetical protein
MLARFRHRLSVMPPGRAGLPGCTKAAKALGPLAKVVSLGPRWLAPRLEALARPRTVHRTIKRPPETMDADIDNAQILQSYCAGPVWQVGILNVREPPSILAETGSGNFAWAFHLVSSLRHQHSGGDSRREPAKLGMMPSGDAVIEVVAILVITKPRPTSLVVSCHVNFMKHMTRELGAVQLICGAWSGHGLAVQFIGTVQSHAAGLKEHGKSELWQCMTDCCRPAA